MYKVFLGIGGNIGNKPENFSRVRNEIGDKIGTIVKFSSVYETPPWGFSSDDVFWNQVFEVETRLEAEEILWRINEVEEGFGRKRGEGGGGYLSRPMDIDILYFNDDYFETKSLIVPHPRIQERRFVLVPLVEIAPEYKHPLLRLTNSELLKNCRDNSVIKRLDV